MAIFRQKKKKKKNSVLEIKFSNFIKSIRNARFCNSWIFLHICTLPIHKILSEVAKTCVMHDMLKIAKEISFDVPSPFHWENETEKIRKKQWGKDNYYMHNLYSSCWYASNHNCSCCSKLVKRKIMMITTHICKLP